MATTHSREHDDFLGSDLPPPAYELTSSELDRKIADATQRSLTLQQEQLQRPNLPPRMIDVPHSYLTPNLMR
jgi:hypothetical protein